MITTAKEVFKTTPGMVPARRRKLLSQVHVPDEETPLTLGSALFIWFAHLLLRRSNLDSAVQDLILETYQQAIVAYGERLTEAIENKEGVIPVAAIHLVDEHYVIMSGNTKFLDLREGKMINGLDNMGIETVVWSLPRLFSDRMHKLCRGQGRAQPGQ